MPSTSRPFDPTRVLDLICMGRVAVDLYAGLAVNNSEVPVVAST